MSLWANIKFFPEPTGELYGWLLATLVFNVLPHIPVLDAENITAAEVTGIIIIGLTAILPFLVLVSVYVRRLSSRVLDPECLSVPKSKAESQHLWCNR